MNDCAPEFVKILTYLQGLPSSSTKKPDYSTIKKQLLGIKDKKGFSSSLEWLAGYNSAMTPTTPLIVEEKLNVGSSD